MKVNQINASNIPSRRQVSAVREREILRVAGSLEGANNTLSARTARGEVLKWAQNKAISPLPASAWSHQSFEQLASGRSQVAVRLPSEEGADYWTIRVEVPDTNIAGRIWTTEIVIEETLEAQAKFSARLLVGSAETSLEIEPHVPGVVRQIIDRPGLLSGPFKVVGKPLTIKKSSEAEQLANALENEFRTLPIIVLSVPEGSADPLKPLLDAKKLAEACAGLATVIILPAEFTWNLTTRYGKRLSVYEGAARIYLPGFKEDDNPFGGHELLLPKDFLIAPHRALTRLRWLAANASLTRLQLGRDLTAFATIRLRSLEDRQAVLRDAGADAREQLSAAQDVIKNLEEQIIEAERYQKYFSELHMDAESRADLAETQLRGSEFRIRQLTRQLRDSNIKPDADISLPTSWDDFADWCEDNLAGRVTLTPEARRSTRDPEFRDLALTARCVLWLANDYLDDRLNGGEGTLRDKVIETGIKNSPCGGDEFQVKWQGKWRTVDWHIKNGGNSRDPSRCLRVYYFWDEQSQQVVVADLPSHRRTDAS